MSSGSTTTGGRGARERILHAATELFYRDGINATGVERLANHASVSKRTLYQHFPSKEAVVEEYLRLAGSRSRPPIPDEKIEGPRERLLAVFDTPAVPTSGATLRGCPFHNAAVEAAGTMPGVQDIVHAAKLSFRETLAELAEAAGAADPQRLAGQLAVVHEGAAALSTSLDDLTVWARAKDAAAALIDAATG